MADDERDWKFDDDTGGAGPPAVPGLGRPLVRAEFWATGLALAALVFGGLAAARALDLAPGEPWLLGLAALAQFGLAVHYARRPAGYARGTLPVPGRWYRLVAVVVLGVVVGAVAAMLLG